MSDGTLRRKRLLLLGTTVGLLAGLLGVAELACRLLIPAPVEVHWNQFRWGVGPCYRAELTTRGRVLSKVDAVGWFAPPGSSPVSFPAARTPGVARVAVLGESSAEMLEVALATFAKPSLEVMRCAVPGGDTALVLERTEEITGYHPDAVVLAMGHNVRWRVQRDTAGRALAFLRDHSRLALALSRVRSRSLPAPNTAERVGFLAESLRRFEAQTRAARVRGIYVILPSNLRFAPQTDPAGERSTALFDARLAWWEGRPDEAIAGLSRLAEGSAFAQWHFELGDWLLARGDYANARAHLVRARDLDPMEARTTVQINETIRAAAVRAGGAVYDLDARVTAHAPHGIAGWESLMDNCHPAQFILTRSSLDLLQLAACPVGGECPAGRPRAGSAALVPPGWDHGVGGHDNRGENPHNEIATGLRNVLQQFLLSDDQHRPAWALNLEQAIGSWALELDAPMMRLLVANSLASDGVQRAAPEHRDVVATAMAAGLERGGDHDGAREVLRAVLARGRSVDGWMLAGRLAVAEGRRPDAAAAFARAAALAPSRLDAPYYAARLAAPR